MTIKKKKTTRKSKTPPPSLNVMTSVEFAERELAHEWLVESILLGRQPAVIGGPKKTMKTGFLVDLAVSLGSGTFFLDKFPVTAPRRVLVLSGESGETTLKETAERICESKEIALSELDVLWGFNLPTLASKSSRDSLNAQLRSESVDVVCIDPLYLCLTDGAGSISASNLYDVGPVLRKTAQACLSAGATPILVHHTRKQDGRTRALDLDDLAFAGIPEFVRQWVLINRREPYQVGTGTHKLRMSVGGSAGHSSLWCVDILEGVMNSTLNRRKWQVSVAEDNDLIEGT